MSENRKYYYLKLKENFFTTEKMVILESAQDGLLYSNLLLKIYLMSLKSGGILMLGDGLPHTPQTIATFTRHQIGTVERALKLFIEFGFVEVLTDGTYYMADIQLLIGQSSTEGERKKEERMRLKRQKLLPSGQTDKCPPYSGGDICLPEIRDKRLDIRDKSIENRDKNLDIRECEREKNAHPPTKEENKTNLYGRYENVRLTDKEMETLKSDFPAEYQSMIEHLSEYMASKGKTYKNHLATMELWKKADMKEEQKAGRGIPITAVLRRVTVYDWRGC